MIYERVIYESVFIVTLSIVPIFMTNLETAPFVSKNFPGIFDDSNNLNKTQVMLNNWYISLFQNELSEIKLS